MSVPLCVPVLVCEQAKEGLLKAGAASRAGPFKGRGRGAKGEIAYSHTPF